MITAEIVVGEDEAPTTVPLFRRPDLFDDVLNRPLAELAAKHARRRAEVAVVRAAARRLDRVGHQVVARVEQVLARRHDRRRGELRPIIDAGDAAARVFAPLNGRFPVGDQVRQRGLGVTLAHAVAVLQCVFRQGARVNPAHDDRHAQPAILVGNLVRPLGLRGHGGDADDVNVRLWLDAARRACTRPQPRRPSASA